MPSASFRWDVSLSHKAYTAIACVHPVPMYHWYTWDSRGMSIWQSHVPIPYHWYTWDSHGISLCPIRPTLQSYVSILSQCTIGTPGTPMECLFGNPMCPSRPNVPLVHHGMSFCPIWQPHVSIPSQCTTGTPGTPIGCLSVP